MESFIRKGLVAFARSVNKSLPHRFHDLSKLGWSELIELYPELKLDRINSHFQQSQTFDTDPAAVVFCIDQGSVWGNTGTVITSNGIMIADVSNEFVTEPAFHSLFQQWRMHTPKKIGPQISVIATTGSSVYYHWLLQNFPRIHLLQKAGLLDKLNGVIMNYTALPFQDDCLKQIDFPYEKIITSNARDFHIQAQKLWVPSLPFRPFGADNVAKWACKFVRDAFSKGAAPQKGKRKLYISRAGSLGRNIVNEKELLAELEPLGFERHGLDNLSVGEQAQLFREAEIIVAPHGGALTNIVFCDPGTRVVDIFNKRWINPCFWDIATKVDLRYQPYFGQTYDDKKILDSKHYDIFVDIPDFLAFLTGA